MNDIGTPGYLPSPGLYDLKLNRVEILSVSGKNHKITLSKGINAEMRKV